VTTDRHVGDLCIMRTIPLKSRCPISTCVWKAKLIPSMSDCVTVPILKSSSVSDPCRDIPIFCRGRDLRSVPLSSRIFACRSNTIPEIAKSFSRIPVSELVKRKLRIGKNTMDKGEGKAAQVVFSHSLHPFF